MRYLTALLILLAVTVASADTAITYQGQLQDGSGPFTGTPGMEFRLHDSLTGGNQIGGSEFFSGVPVEDGLFQVELDFGQGAFDGSERYLEIEVSGATLSPRQKITGAPSAQFALEVAPGSVGSDQIAPGSVGSDELVADSLTVASGTGLLGGGEIALGGTITLSIADGAVGSAQIAAGAVGSSEIAPGAVGVDELADDLDSKWTDSGARLQPKAGQPDALEVGEVHAGSIDAQDYLKDGLPFTPAQTIVQTLAPDHDQMTIDPGTVWMRLDEPGTELWEHTLHGGGVQSIFERGGVV